MKKDKMLFDIEEASKILNVLVFNFVSYNGTPPLSKSVADDIASLLIDVLDSLDNIHRNLKSSIIISAENREEKEK